MYSAASSQPGGAAADGQQAAPSPEPGEKKDEVVDAEFVDVDDKPKS
jgi:hypothetical protein